MIAIAHNVQLGNNIFVRMSTFNQKIVQLIFCNCFDWLKTTVEIKNCKREINITFYCK